MSSKKSTSYISLFRKIIFLLAGLGIGVGHHLRERDFSHSIEESMIKCYFSPKGGCAQAIINAIDQAEKEIHIYIFSFTLESIADALKRAEARHVKVHIIADNTQANGIGSQIANLGTWLDNLFIDSQKGVGHHKFVVIDRKVVVFGSFNYSKSAERYNREAIVKINDEKTALKFYDEWMKQKKEQGVSPYKIRNRK